MKKNSLFVVMTLALLTLASCGKKEKSFKELEETYLPKPEMALTAQDTAEVTSLAEHYLQLLEQRELEDAAGMLYYLKGDSVLPLRPDQLKNQLFVLKHFKGVEYKMEHIIFRDKDNSEVRCMVKLFEPKEGSTRPNKLALVLRPVRHEGKWYLTTNLD